MKGMTLEDWALWYGEMVHLYLSGKNTNTKVSFYMRNGEIYICIKDSEHETFKAALNHLQRIAEVTVFDRREEKKEAA